MSCNEYCDLDAPDCVSIKEWGEILEVLMNEVRCDKDEFDGCDQVGVWEWGDPDGCEILCDNHKNDNFYSDGPNLIDNRVRTRDLLSEGGRK